VLGYTRNLNKFKKIKIIPTVFSNHNSMKLKNKNRRKLEISQIGGN
jgi:hypothetical protein